MGETLSKNRENREAPINPSAAGALKQLETLYSNKALCDVCLIGGEGKTKYN